MKLLSSLAQWVRSLGVGGVQNLSMLGGAVAVSHGLSRVYAPAGELAAGAFALAFAWLLAKAER